jgi:hypothetical protein
MDVIGHQAVRMDGAPMLARELAQVRQVHQVIRFVAKAGHAVIAALDNVNGNAGQDEPEWSGHTARTTAAVPGLTEFGL